MDSHTIEQIFTLSLRQNLKAKAQYTSGFGCRIRLFMQHKGYITVRSEEGEGNSFTIYIPQSEKQVISEMNGKNGAVRSAGVSLIEWPILKWYIYSEGF